MKLKVILGSTREGRQGLKVFDWTRKALAKHQEFETEFIDLKDWKLPFFDSAVSPAYGTIDNELVMRWTKKIAEADAFLILTPEYNHGYPAVLKNALDYVYKEWNNKPVAFISYSAGPLGGIRAVEQLRQVVVELQMVPIREGLHIPNIFTEFDEKGPKSDSWDSRMESMLKQLEWWTRTLNAGRNEKLEKQKIILTPIAH